MMNVSHLGQQVKQLHPGHYDHLDDAVVGKALQRKFPGVYDHFKDIPQRNLDHGTIPEAPKTLQKQLSQLDDGLRRAVFIPRGARFNVKPANGQRKITLPSGEFYYKPELIRPQEIIRAVQEHRLNEILGAAEGGYGAPPKEELRPPVEAVVSRDKEGETVHGALTDREHEPTAVEAAHKLKPEGGTVSVGPPETEIANRVKKNKFKWPAGKKWPKGGTR